MELKSTNNFFNYSTSLPGLLYRMKSSLVISTYQAGKVIIVSSLDGEHIRLYGKNFSRPMGLCISGSKLAVASSQQLNVFSSSREMAFKYPKKPKFYDGMFFPQVTYHTGKADIHEIEWGNEELWCVNTAFSCLSVMDDVNHFKAKWKPHFITELSPDDKCHLNGMAMLDGEPKVVSLLGMADEKKGWKPNMLEGGLLMDVPSNTVIADSLPIPHSPKYDEGKLSFLLSGTGKIMQLDQATNEMKEIASANAFLRGMDIYKDMILVGKSGLRKDSSMYDKLSFPKEGKPGVGIFNKNSGEEIAQINFLQRVEEIFDVKVMPGLIRPVIVDDTEELSAQGFKLPGGAYFWENLTTEATDTKK